MNTVQASSLRLDGLESIPMVTPETMIAMAAGPGASVQVVADTEGLVIYVSGTYDSDATQAAADDAREKFKGYPDFRLVLR